MRVCYGTGKYDFPKALCIFVILSGVLTGCASTRYLPNLSVDKKSSAVFKHGSTEIVNLFLVDNEPRDFIDKRFDYRSYSVANDPGQFNIGLNPGEHSFVFFTNKYWDDINRGGSLRLDLAMDSGKTYELKRKPDNEWYVECNNEEVTTAKITQINPFCDYDGSDAAYLTIPSFQTEKKVFDDKSWHAIDVLFVDKVPGQANKKFWPFLNNYDTPRTLKLSPGEHELLLTSSTRSYIGPSILQKMIVTLKPGEKVHLEITDITAEKGGALVSIEKIVD